MPTPRRCAPRLPPWPRFRANASSAASPCWAICSSLGTTPVRLHEDLKEPVDAAEVDLVFACGLHMQRLYAALPTARRGEWGPTSQDILGPLVAAVHGGDVVMIKGSLGSRMEPLVEALVRKSGTGPVAR